jgi:hypothetical protein
MKKLSPLERLSACLVAINFFAINLFVIINSMIQEKRDEEFPVSFQGFSRKSQMHKVLDESTIRVAIQDNSAYWVVDNILYTANVSKDGRILNENAERVNVFDLSEKEISNLLSIIDTISS